MSQENILTSRLGLFSKFWSLSNKFNILVGHHYVVVSRSNKSFDRILSKNSSIPSISTTSSKINRRSIFFFGFLTLSLLLFQTGWHVHRSITTQDFPELWPFKLELFKDSSTWFYALIQVIFSTNIGVGALPVMTGKFLYKGDAVR